MKKMYYLLLIALLGSISTTFAQSEGMLTGTITDQDKTAVGFANVAVVDAATSSVVTGAIADMDGHFKIKTPAKGTYLLKVNSLGYVTFQSPPFEITSPNTSRDFGKLELASDAKVLKEVTVQALRPTIINEADKMVVSVEGTALASGSTAYEVLEKSPGVWVDQDGNITLNGKAGVQIMLNGKPSYLSGKDLQNLLQGVSAENLKDLEIITTPSARYDAEGASGIININLKKSLQAGMNGSVYAGYQYNRLHGYSTGANINLKKGKWNTSLNADFSDRPRFRDMEMERILTTDEGKRYLQQNGYEKRKNISPTMRLATDYDITDRHSIGAVVNLRYAENTGTFNTNTLLRDPASGNDSTIFSGTTNSNRSQNGTLNLHYTGKITEKSTLTADLDYAKLENKNETGLLHSFKHRTSGKPAITKQYITDNPTNYDIYSAKADFSTKAGQKGKLETGAKYSHVVSDNELRFYDELDGVREYNKDRSSHFIFTENIAAAYVNYNTKLNEKWSLQAGLRAEYTLSKGNSKTLNHIKNRDYLNLFPSIFLQQQVSENYQIGYKYSRRINRPYYEHLNPFIFFIDPYTMATGNPHLKPQYSSNFEVTQMFKQRYNFIVGYSHTTNYIGEVPVFYADKNQTIFERRNMDDFIDVNATLVAPVSVMPGKWEINNNITLMHQKYKTTIHSNTQTTEATFLYAQSSHTVMLPKNIRLEVSGTYQGPAVYGLFEISDMWWVDAGLKRSFLDDKLTMAVNVTDIFKTRLLNIDTNINGDYNKINQYHGQQGVRLHLSYNFLKGKAFETKKRNTNLEELNRTGN